MRRILSVHSKSMSKWQALAVQCLLSALVAITWNNNHCSSTSGTRYSTPYALNVNVAPS